MIEHGTRRLLTDVQLRATILPLSKDTHLLESATKSFLSRANDG